MSQQNDRSVRKPFAAWLRGKIEYHCKDFSPEDERQAAAVLAALSHARENGTARTQAELACEWSRCVNHDLSKPRCDHCPIEALASAPITIAAIVEKEVLPSNLVAEVKCVSDKVMDASLLEQDLFNLARVAMRTATALSATPCSADSKDAARYRWLRDKSEPGICTFYLSVGAAFHKIRFTPQTVDEAIDDQINRPDGAVQK